LDLEGWGERFLEDRNVQRELFTGLYRRHYAAVLAYALRRVGPDQAQDVVAETFTAAWRELANLPENPMPWLYRAAWYRIANERRSQTRQVRASARAQTQQGQIQGDHASRVVESVRVLGALKSLSDTDREVLLLTSWEDLSYPDVAYVLGCSVTAVKVRVLRARRRLAAALKNEPVPRPRPTPAEVS
jgi:RNA polymerase sigma-70 factor (ECF subfamily)